MKLNKILNRFSVAVLAKSFFIKNLFHLITTLRCSNIDQEGLPTRPHIHTPQPNPTNTHAHTRPTQGKRGRERGKRGREGGPFVCDLGMMCGMGVDCKRICCGAGVMWCSAGEEKRERVEGEKSGTT